MAGRPRKFTRPLSEADKALLEKIANSRSEDLRQIQRAKIILMAADGASNAEITKAVGLSVPSVINTLKKWALLGIDGALKDLSRSGRPNIIDLSDKTWVVNLACICPKELADGPAAQMWSTASLASYVRKHCEDEGHAALKNVSKSQIHSILEDNSIKPHRMKYYLVKKDPEFQKKSENVLLLYKRVDWIQQLVKPLVEQGMRADEAAGEVIISYDEKPGIQAIGSIAPDLAPNLKYGTMARDYEYRRLGTVSLLAGIDLFTGEVTGIVRDRHGSDEFIEFLQSLDEKYPQGITIRMILDNLKVHSSKKVMEYLASHPARFDFTFTPTHSSWLNLIESFFSKLARQALRGLRVTSKQELVEHIMRWIDQVNAEPVPYRWKWNTDDIWSAFTKNRELANT